MPGGGGWLPVHRPARLFLWASERVGSCTCKPCLPCGGTAGRGGKQKQSRETARAASGFEPPPPPRRPRTRASTTGGWLAGCGSEWGRGSTSHPEKQKRVPTGGGRSKSGVSVGVGGPRPRWRKRALLWIARLGSCIDRQAGRPGQGAAGTLLHYTAQPAREAGIGPAGVAVPVRPRGVWGWGGGETSKHVHQARLAPSVGSPLDGT